MEHVSSMTILSLQAGIKEASSFPMIYSSESPEMEDFAEFYLSFLLPSKFYCHPDAISPRFSLRLWPVTLASPHSGVSGCLNEILNFYSPPSLKKQASQKFKF